MQGIFRKENTDKALKYGIYRHLPTYEKIIRNLVSFLFKTLMLEKIFGFIEEEVDGLYEKYLVDTVNPNGKLLDKFWSI